MTAQRMSQLAELNDRCPESDRLLREAQQLSVHGERHGAEAGGGRATLVKRPVGRCVFAAMDRVLDSPHSPEQHTQHVQRAKATVVTNTPANGSKLRPITEVREKFLSILAKNGFSPDEIVRQAEMFDGFEGESDKREFATEIVAAVKSGDLKPDDKPTFADPFSEVTPISEAVQ